MAPERPVRGSRPRPDPRPLRLLLGAGCIASAAAILTAMLPSVAPHATVTSAVTTADAIAPTPSVVHVTHYVVLKPGETAPPQAPVVVQPTPTPRVHVVTVTRQSGMP